MLEIIGFLFDSALLNLYGNAANDFDTKAGMHILYAVINKF
jgi:hypothetical protein